MTEQMKALIARLLEADEAYYGRDDPIMSDYEYDRLYDELVRLEKESGIVLAASPTQRVPGEVLDSLATVTHTKPMLSAGKTKAINEIFKFIGGRKVILSWKLDGLTLVLRYKEGKLVQAITRGDGLKGEDVTHTVRVMGNVPLTIPCTDPLEVRGEGVVSWQNFRALNETLEDPYSHPRNLAAGSIRKLDANESRKRRVEFLAFDLISDSLGGATKWEQLRFMAQMGFTTVGYSILAANAPLEALEQAVAWYRPEEYAYPVDGLIFEYDDLDYGRSLGATGHHENRLMALKWKDTLYETVFRSLEVATTRTGMVSLTGVFDDVEIDGTTVNHAYLHNLDIFKALALGPGDKISVYKANMIIPQIAENLTGSDNVEIPKVCPVCGQPTEIRQMNEVQSLYCTNEKCPAKEIKSYTLFVSRDALNIDGLSEATLEKLIDQGFIHEYADLFRLDRYKEVITGMEGFGEKSYQNMMDSIETARHTTLPRLIYGLGIAGIGVANAKVLCRYFDYDLERMQAADEETLSAIPGVGEVLASTFTDYMRDAENLEKIAHLKEILTIETPQIDESAQTLAGMSFVVTGSLNHYASRNDLKEVIEEKGGKVTGSVTGKTTCLINNDITSTSSKNKKAKELQVPILTEEEFLRTYNIPYEE